ncbi:MAG: GNAT family N-acetyltransferase [Spirochaetota bacterium]
MKKCLLEYALQASSKSCSNMNRSPQLKMTNSSIQITVHRGLPGFNELESAWNDLAKVSGTHFLHYPAWYGAELQHSGGDNVYFLSLTDTKGALFAVLPFQWTTIKIKFFKLPIVQLYYPNEMGVNDVLTNTSLFPYRNDIAKALRKTLPFFLFVRWQCLMENGCAAALDVNKSFRNTHYSKYLHFSKGYEDFIERYSNKFRKDLLKKMRKIEEKGNLELRILQEGKDLDAAFNQFLQVENSGWKGQDGTSILKQPWKLNYYMYLKQHFSSLGLCRINLLTLNDEAIAAQFGIAISNKLYLLKIGFREDFSEFSPGFLLLYKLIERYCQEKSLHTISFVTGVDWINRWHPDAVSVGIFYSSNGSILSTLTVRALRAVLKIREAIKAKSSPQSSEHNAFILKRDVCTGQ